MDWKSVAALGWLIPIGIFLWVVVANSLPFVHGYVSAPGEVCFRKHVWADPVVCVP